MNTNILLAGHSGSANRGCEAIVKSTADLFKQNKTCITLATHDVSWDRKLGTTEFDHVIAYRAPNKKNPYYDALAVLSRFTRNHELQQAYFQKDVMKAAAKNDILLLVGGDTYCYEAPVGHMYANRYAKTYALKSILWGCSIGKENLTDSIIKDLKRYRLICPRESLTYELMQSIGIPEDRLCLMADPAFTLKPLEYPLPEGFQVKNTVGINVSPICIKNEHLLAIVKNMVRHILDHTDFSVALIPHVFAGGSSQDLYVLKKLQVEFTADSDLKRICIFDDMNLSCRHLKFIISACRFLITARTHASIAAYSTAVPTFALGYSSKSIGIARDLFGADYTRYVANYSALQSENDLVNALEILINNEKEIVVQLAEKTKLFQDRAYTAVDKVCHLETDY